MTDKQRLKIYRDALSNIHKLCGICWDGKRKCHDEGQVAAVALQKAEPKYWKSIDSERFQNFFVKRDGSFHRRKRK